MTRVGDNATKKTAGLTINQKGVSVNPEGVFVKPEEVTVKPDGLHSSQEKLVNGENLPGGSGG